MLSYFKSQQPTAIAFFVLLFWMIKLPFLFQPVPVTLPVIHNIWMDAGLLFPDRPALSFFIAQFLLLGEAIWFNYLFHKADFHESNTMLPAVYFTLATSLLPAFNYLNLYHFLMIILFLLFRVLLQINSKETAKAESYNAGFITGLLLLLLPELILFTPFLFMMLYVLKPFRFNEYILLIMGLGTPLYMAAGINYLCDYPQDLSIYWENLFHPFYAERDVLTIILLVLTGLYLLFSFISLRGILFSVGFRRRKNVNMLVFFSLGMAAVVVGSGQLWACVLALLWLPASTFLTLLILRVRRKKAPETLHIAFLLTIFIINIIRIVR